MDTKEGERIDGEEEKKRKPDGECSIDIKDGKTKAEKMCRICHFGKESTSSLIPLGCDCKGELGSSHHHCAQLWFTHKGNRICEICGKTAKNINNGEETSIFMMEWDEMREVVANLDASGESTLRCKQCSFNVVLGSLLLLFILLWFFKGIKI